MRPGARCHELVRAGALGRAGRSCDSAPAPCSALAGWRPGSLGRRWRKPRSAAGDYWHNLFITKQLSATLTVELILAELMEATVREMPHMVDREVLEVSNCPVSIRLMGGVNLVDR